MNLSPCGLTTTQEKTDGSWPSRTHSHWRHSKWTRRNEQSIERVRSSANDIPSLFAVVGIHHCRHHSLHHDWSWTKSHSNVGDSSDKQLQACPSIGPVGEVEVQRLDYSSDEELVGSDSSGEGNHWQCWGRTPASVCSVDGCCSDSVHRAAVSTANASTSQDAGRKGVYSDDHCCYQLD